MKGLSRKARILAGICAVMFTLGVLFFRFMFTKWGWRLDCFITSHIDLPPGFAIAFLGTYWLIVFGLFLAVVNEIKK